MKTTVLFSLLPVFLLAADLGPTKRQVAKEMEEAWRAIEPHLFISNAGKKPIGTWVRFTGAPISLRVPLVIKLPTGTIARLEHVQKADRRALESFQKPPSVVIAFGPITAIDAKNRTVTINAESTAFGP